MASGNVVKMRPLYGFQGAKKLIAFCDPHLP
jgi:hypothetical protein